MKLKAHKNKYYLKVSFTERDIPAHAGFAWSRKHKCWETDCPIKAYRFINSADPESALELYKQYTIIQSKLESSRALSSDFEVPAPEGMTYFPFQRAGIEFLSQRFSSLLADDMGLGKTIQAIGFMNLHPGLMDILIVCPASLKLMWKKSVDAWQANSWGAQVLQGGSEVSHPDIKGAQVIIINYDILKKHRKYLRSVDWDLIILDECHYIKNKKAQRTKEITGFRNMKPLKAEYKIALTGTPVTNGKPIDMWATLNWLDPEAWPDYWKYVHRYCGAYQDQFGLNVSGATNLNEFQHKLRSTLMLRRLKKDVLTDLPDKIREVIEIPESGKIIRQEQKKLKSYREGVDDLKVLSAIEFSEMAQIRHDTALLKVPFVVERLKSVIETGQKVICFAWHQDVIDGISKGLLETKNSHTNNINGAKKAVTVTGKTSMKDRESAVDLFQNDLECTAFIGNIQAAGTGITLTAASTVIFAELSWVPGEMTQAEDRAHRIGQENSVLVQHLVLEGSIDAIMAKRLVAKQALNDKALDISETGSEDLAEAMEEIFKM